MQKQQQTQGITAYMLTTGKRKIKDEFFRQIGWKAITKIIQKNTL